SFRPVAASPAFCSNALPMADAISGPESAHSIWSSARRTESVPSTAPASVAGRSRQSRAALQGRSSGLAPVDHGLEAYYRSLRGGAILSAAEEPYGRTLRQPR